MNNTTTATKDYMAAWRQKNREKYNLRIREWRHKNKKRVKLIQQRYYWKNKGRLIKSRTRPWGESEVLDWLKNKDTKHIKMMLRILRLEKDIVIGDLDRFLLLSPESKITSPHLSEELRTRAFLKQKITVLSYELNEALKAIERFRKEASEPKMIEKLGRKVTLDFDDPLYPYCPMRLTKKEMAKLANKGNVKPGNN